MRLLEGGVVAGLVAARHGRVHDVQPRVEQRPAARPRHHRQLVDGGVGVTLRLQAGLGDAATSDNKFSKRIEKYVFTGKNNFWGKKYLIAQKADISTIVQVSFFSF